MLLHFSIYGAKKDSIIVEGRDTGSMDEVPAPEFVFRGRLQQTLSKYLYCYTSDNNRVKQLRNIKFNR